VNDVQGHALNEIRTHSISVQAIKSYTSHHAATVAGHTVLLYKLIFKDSITEYFKQLVVKIYRHTVFVYAYSTVYIEPAFRTTDVSDNLATPVSQLYQDKRHVPHFTIMEGRLSSVED
jgi:hypothetical protein